MKTNTTEDWGSIPFRFATHIVVGVLMFMAVGLAALFLHFFIGWLDSYNIAPWMISVSTMIEYGLYAMDLVLFILYTIRTTIHHGRIILTTRIK